MYFAVDVAFCLMIYVFSSVGVMCSDCGLSFSNFSKLFLLVFCHFFQYSVYFLSGSFCICRMCLCFYDLRFVDVLLMMGSKVFITLLPCALIFILVFVCVFLIFLFLLFTIDLNIFKIFDMLWCSTYLKLLCLFPCADVVCVD
jgi:hypothetical protein